MVIGPLADNEEGTEDDVHTTVQETGLDIGRSEKEEEEKWHDKFEMSERRRRSSPVRHHTCGENSNFKL